MVHELHFIFEGWLGDQIVTSFPVYLVTSTLAESFLKAGLTGFELAEAEIETEEQFEELYPDVTLPPFKWLRITGSFGDDFYMAPNHRLAGSQAALDAILATGPADFDYKETEG